MVPGSIRYTIGTDNDLLITPPIAVITYKGNDRICRTIIRFVQYDIDIRYGDPGRTIHVYRCGITCGRGYIIYKDTGHRGNLWIRRVANHSPVLYKVTLRLIFPITPG